MNKKLIIFILLITLLLSACGAKEKLEEAAAEQIAETIIEQASGIEDVEIDADGGSFSYSVEDDEGGSTSVQVNSEQDIDAIVGMGFNIPLPDEFVNGTIQEVQENGEVITIAATFETGGLNNDQIYDALHQSLTAAGFVYADPMGTGATQPDPSITPSGNYQHPDGFIFSIFGGEDGLVLGLSRDTSAIQQTESDASTSETAVSDLPTTLDGSMTLDKESYTTGESIEVSLVINTPLADNGWVGIVPSDTPHGDESENDRYDVAYQYVRNLDNGIITLNAPSVAGEYDVRLFNTDSNGVELASISIQVTE